VQYRLRDVRWEHVDAEHGTCTIVPLEALCWNAVCVGALGPPAGVPDFRTLQDGIGVDRVHTDAVSTTFRREAARQTIG